MTQVNGTGMYKLEPYYDFERIPVELPTCMFKMPSYHHDHVQPGPPGNDDQVDPKLIELERRQERILQELKSLENEVASLTSRFQPAADITQPDSSGSIMVNSRSTDLVNMGDVIHDIVIYANPAQPPFSLSVLYEMLKLHYRCRSAVHTHSSVKSLPSNLVRYLGNGLETSRSEAPISLTLIWKDVSHGPIMMVAAPTQSPINGEANIARYVARLLNPGYDSADIAYTSSIDNWLDLATSSLLGGNSKEKAAAVRSLNVRLGKHDWLVGSSVSVADAICWSAVQSTGQAAGAPSNVQMWLKACVAHSLFQTACTLLAP